MIRFLVLLFLLGPTAVLLGAEPLKVLTIGNSFANNATAYLGDIAEKEGQPMLIGRANLGGASFERHLKAIAAWEKDPQSSAAKPYPSNFTPEREKGRTFSLQELLEAEKWDVVTIQQVSSASYKFDTFEPYVGSLIAYIRKYAPGAEIVIHQTWAYREDYPEYTAEFTPDKMYAGLKDSYQKLAEKYHLRIIPVGDAFQLARQSENWRFQFPDPNFDYASPSLDSLPEQKGSLNKGWGWSEKGEKKLVLDFKHANVAGKYLGALVWYETLTGKKPGPTTFVPEGLEAKAAEDLRRLAAAAVQNNSSVRPAP